MATIDEDLSQIEKDIRRLKIEYEQFFGGGRPRPPADTQWRLESLMRRYNERTAELSFGQRFRFTNLDANLRQVRGHVAQENRAEGRRRFATSFRRGRQSDRSSARARGQPASETAARSRAQLRGAPSR